MGNTSRWAILGRWAILDDQQYLAGSDSCILILVAGSDGERRQSWN